MNHLEEEIMLVKAPNLLISSSETTDVHQMEGQLSNWTL